MKIAVIEKKNVDVKFIKISAKVRYWDDAEIDGIVSEVGADVPFKTDDLWQPVIDIDTGIIVDWPIGTTASFHFKVCDAGNYYLLDKDKREVASRLNNYVPDGLCHGDSGFGDYIIFKVDETGQIINYTNRIDASDWEDDE